MSSRPNGKKQATLSRFFTPTKKLPAIPSFDPNNGRLSSKRKIDEPNDPSVSASPDTNLLKTLEANNCGEVDPKNSSLDSGPKDKDPSTHTLTRPAKQSRTSKATEKSVATKSSKLKLTPLEQQFKKLKLENLDKILAIQVGYKFKFFGQDAVVASHLLNIMLIPGNIELDEQVHDRFCYCLIPDSRLHVHLQRLLNNGLKVGVVKQTETAAVKSVDGHNKSGLFERKITGIYTRATYMGDELFTGDPTINRSNNVDYVADSSYIICIDELNYPKEIAIVAVQPVTGSIVFDTFSDSFARDNLGSRLAFLNPSEVIVVGSTDSISRETKLAIKLQNPNANSHFKKQKSIDTIHADLVDFFQQVESSGRFKALAEHYTLHYPSSIQSCINELIIYLSEFKLSSVFTIPENFVSLTDAKKFMLLPLNTLNALDIFQVQNEPNEKKGTLLWLLDHCHTRNGLNLLRSWIGKPLIDKNDILKRQDAITALKSDDFVHLLDAFKKSLANLGKSGVDLDRSLIKVHYSSAHQTDKISRTDIYTMIKSFSDILQLFKNFGMKGIDECRSKLPHSELLIEILQSMHTSSSMNIVEDFLKQINPAYAIDDKDLSKQKIGFFHVDRYPDEFFDIQRELNELATLDLLLNEALDEIRTYLKRPQLSFVTVLKDTHLIEVRNTQVDSLPKDWVKIGATKSVSRFRPPKVSSLHKRRLYHSEKLLSVCDESFNRFLQNFDSHYIYFKEIVQNLATIDCLLSLAKAATSDATQNYANPNFVHEQVLDIHDASHPILLRLNAQSLYVPNNVNLSYDNGRVLIITGPNMGGKSSYVKQVALLVIMAQIGCHIPCTKATMGIFDSVFVRMGASDDILRGKSTFMVEMLESANIINQYTLRSLVILDEIGRGTGTVDGISLAHSILKYVIEDKAGPLTFFITHYPSLHVLETEYLIVKNYHMAFIEMTREESEDSKWPEVIFLYKLVKGVVSNLYGLNVANMAGINKAIIENAYDVSEMMKRKFEHDANQKWLSNLNSSSVLGLLNSI